MGTKIEPRAISPLVRSRATIRPQRVTTRTSAPSRAPKQQRIGRMHVHEGLGQMRCADAASGRCASWCAIDRGSARC